jgi:hypothetical protein
MDYCKFHKNINKLSNHSGGEGDQLAPVHLSPHSFADVQHAPLQQPQAGRFGSHQFTALRTNCIVMYGQKYGYKSSAEGIALVVLKQAQNALDAGALALSKVDSGKSQQFCA